MGKGRAMSYIIGVVIGGALIAALYELLVLPLLVGKPRALWGRWPVEAQSDVYERGFQAAMTMAIKTTDHLWATFDKPTRDGLDDHGLRCKAAACVEIAQRLRQIASGARVNERDDLPRGVAGAVGPDTTGPTGAMRRKIDDAY